MGKRYNRIKRLVKEGRVSYNGTRDFDGGWRKKILAENDWTPIAGSIANSTSQSFVHPTGATTTVSGLGGVETTPSTVTIDAFGDRFDVPAPEYGQYGMQGYAKPLSKEVMKRNAAYEKELEEFRKKQDEQMDKIKSTLINLGTSWEELRANGWALIRDDGTSVMITPTSSNADMFNWTDNVEIKVGRPDPNANGKPYKTVGSGGKNAVGSRLTDTTIHNSKVVKTIKLEIGEPPKRPSVNPQLDASQEFAQKVGADEFMNARVEPDVKPAPSFAEISPEDEQFIKNLSVTPHMVNLFSPGSGIAGTLALQYAKGDMTPMTRSPGVDFDKGVLNMIDAALTKGITPGSVPDRAYSGDFSKAVRQAPIRASIGQFNYEINSSGIRVIDRFNFNDNKSVGILKMIPGMQGIANRLVDIGNKRAINNGQNPTSDNYGIPIDYTIPWSKVPVQLQNKLDPTSTVIPTTWKKVKKRRLGKPNS